jgi:hypothetical protein
MKQRDNNRMRQLYEEWASSGLSLKTYSKQKAISASTFSYWVRKFKKEDLDTSQVNDKRGFSQIPVFGDQISPGAKVAATIHFPSGARLDLFYPVGVDFIKALIQ